ncbi:MAG: hypothetical protein MZV70_16100 [Desulfobacterales bacterium]|nr:hypothetical protein [Desulfobacterales bacterium]
MGYCGLSCIVGPDGQDLARAGTGPALLLADIDPSAISRGRKANPYLIDRRPELYAAPVKPVRLDFREMTCLHSLKHFAACHSF